MSWTDSKLYLFLLLSMKLYEAYKADTESNTE